MWNIILFEDILVVDQLDPYGKTFDKGEKFTMALANTFNMDGTPDTGYYAQIFFCLGGRKSLADKYEYIMHGKLYKISDESSRKLLEAEVYVSFGGLLMLLRGEPSHLAHFELNQRLFLLIRKL